METFRLSGEMNFSAGNVTENWTRWYQKFMNFLIAMEKSTKDDLTKIAILLNLLGDEGVSIFNTFKFDDETNSKKFDKEIDKFKVHCVPRKNVVFERYKFFSCTQLEGQTVDVYLTQLKTLASSCEFGEQEDSLIRDRIVLGLHDKSLQDRLLREPQLSLQKATDFVRASEASREQIKTIKDPQTRCDVDAVIVRRNTRRNSAQVLQSSKGDVFNCVKCGRSHRKRECPAFNKLCNL